LEGGNMTYFALFYDVVDDFLARRTAYREEHLRIAREAHRRGELVLAGALTDPADRALLVFHVADRSVVEEFARNDPYVTNGLVTRWEVRPWAVVIGGDTSEASPKAV
jgi:uncharacterized protein YciI